MFILKRVKFVLQNRKGSILIYVLAFFIFFLSWMSVVVSDKISKIKIDNYRDLITVRLEIETKVIRYYRSEIEDESYSFFFNDSSVSCHKEGNIIFVNVIGKIRIDFKYDIIEDGSFIHSQWED